MNERTMSPPQTTFSPSPGPVRSSLLQRRCACGGTPGPDGECAECRRKRLARQSQRPTQAESSGVPPIVDEVLRSPGQPLDTGSRAFMESRFGRDFGQVRVHTDARAADSARAVGALAYTVGRDIVFRAGQYRPGSDPGKRLLAHELTHVLQQQGSSLQRTSAEPGAGNTRRAEPIEVTPVERPILSRQNPPYPGAITRCRTMGVPCPAPHFHHGTVCRLVDCVRSRTANLPFAISPGVCIYHCLDGQICTCVLLGSSTSAICVLTLCGTSGQAAAETDHEALAERAIAAAEQQFGGGEGEQAERPVGAAPAAQAKLEVNQPGDVYEQEADRVAEKVMLMSDPALRLQARFTCGGTPGPGSGCAGHRDEQSATRHHYVNKTSPPTVEPFYMSPAYPGGGGTLYRRSVSPLSLPEEEREDEPGTRGEVERKAEDSIPQTDSLLLQRAPVGDAPAGEPRRTSPGGTLPYREATNLLDCIRIMGEANAEYCRQEVLGEPPQPLPLPPPVLCAPDRSLTWSDFQGTPPAGGAFGAETHFHHDLVTEQGKQITRAIFETSNSWVRSQFADPSNRAVNRCAGRVRDCERFFAAEAAAGRIGGTFRLGAPTGCAASVAPDPSIVAASQADCASVIGPECDRVAVLESGRLLRHEQTHFDIACVLGKKGTDAIALNPANQPHTIHTAVRTRANQATVQYDAQTAHGCNAGAQASWETDVQNDLPAFPIP